MPKGTFARGDGKAFNRVAAAYDRHRPAYPDQLIDHACELAGITSGDRVLELGCGTGQLTRSLLSRGLRVTALEPGDQLIALARRNLHGSGAVEFVGARFEDVRLPRGEFTAVFSASAIHWIGPDVSWQKAADALVPGGALALVQYFGLDDERSADDQHELRRALAAIAPEMAASWPQYRDLASTLRGVHERRENVSEVWAWLGGYELARAYASRLFADVQIATVPTLVEHTSDELNALLGTMSFWDVLTVDQRAALTSENDAIYERLGRPIRSSTLACLVTARRVD